MNVYDRLQIEKQDLNYTYPGTGSMVHMGSMGIGEGAIEKIKSTSWNYIFMEEANEFTYDDFQILKMRLSEPSLDGKKNQIFMALNPVSSFCYVKTELCDKAKAHDLEEIVSTYKDNQFLSQDYIEILEALQLQSNNLWNIYGLGAWGVLESVVYEKNWDLVDSLPETDDISFGLDYGYNQPSCLIKVAYKDDEPYIQQLLYQTHLTNSQLIERMKDLIPEQERDKDIYADSAEPQRIQEMCDAGFNCKSSDKSVKDGIDYIKSLNVHVTKDSSDIIKEKNSYSYKKDKDNRVVDEVVKYADHSMDAIRYCLYTQHSVHGPSMLWI